MKTLLFESFSWNLILPYPPPPPPPPEDQPEDPPVRDKSNKFKNYTRL